MAAYISSVLVGVCISHGSGVDIHTPTRTRYMQPHHH